ncbi:retrovirus-related pol polyprotein from transposon TNT 1-94 [Tanacetum coccineum]
MKEKGDPCILVGYSTQSKGYRVYNKITRLIVESIHLRFDEIKEMSKTSVANDTLGLVPQRQKESDYDNPDPAPELQNVSPSADTTVPSQQDLDLLFGPLYDEFFNDGTSRVNKSSSPRTFLIICSSNTLSVIEHKYGGVAETKQVSCRVQADFVAKGYAQEEGIDFEECHLLQLSLGAFRFWLIEFATESPVLRSFTKDADHAGCVDTRKSTYGGIQFLGDKLVSWMLKKQDCTAMSSVEAEYVALSASCAQHSRIKQIHTRYHFIKEQVENGIIELYFVRTEYQLVDMFTKALSEDRFQYLVRRIGMRCLTPAELECIPLGWRNVFSEIDLDRSVNTIIIEDADDRFSILVFMYLMILPKLLDTEKPRFIHTNGSSLSPIFRNIIDKMSSTCDGYVESSQQGVARGEERLR